MKELLQIEEPYVYIGDDNLFFDYQHALQIADLVRQAGLNKQFYVLSRVDDIVKHPELVQKWAEIGVTQTQVSNQATRVSILTTRVYVIYIFPSHD